MSPTRNAAMKRFLTILMVSATGLAAGMPWTAVEAKGSSGIRIMKRIVHRDDRVVIVTTAQEGGTWENPDLCDDDRKVALVPEEPVLYGEQLATLRAAFMANKSVSFLLDGCVTLDSEVSIPKITFVSVY